MKMFAIGQVDLTLPLPHQKAERSRFAASPPVWHLAIAWILLIPILYIAANGTFVPHSGQFDYAATGQAPGSDASHKISVALVSVLYVLLIAFRFGPVFRLAQRVKIVLAFPVLGILSCAWSTEPQQSIVSGSVLLLFTAFAIYVASRLSFERQLELLMLVGAVALPLSALLAVVVPSVGASEAGWRGIFGHKQVCAAASMTLLITALHWRAAGAYQKIFHAVYIVLCFGLIIMSQSRTGWVLTLIALFLSAALWLLQKMPPKQGLLAVLVAVPMAAAGMYAIYLLAPTILASVGKDSTLSQRTIIWAAAWDAALKHPFLGYGFAAFWKGLYGPSQSIVLIAGWGLQQAQNGFLDVWLGVGIVGLFVVAAMTLQSMRNAIRSFHSCNHQAYVRWCIVVIVTTLLYNIGESSIGLTNISWFLFLLAIIGLSQTARERYEPDRYVI
jgi:exopolysaccharide production protein ExoQ